MPTPVKAPHPRLKLRYAREAIRFSQRALAEAAGITAATMSDMESGRNHKPSHDHVVKVFQALVANGMDGYSLDDLFPVPAAPVNRVLNGRRRRA
jgi:transcriptional regulator with XRE-family HTH domain